PEYELLRPDLVLFTYLHLAATPALTRVLVERRVRALAYETLQPGDGSLPLLAPMSEVAGRLAVQAGAWCLQAQSAGRGVLISGASGVRPAKVVILGAGIAGTNACQVAVGVGADVSILDVDPAKLRYVHDILGGHVTTVMSNRANLEEEVLAADLVIGSVLIPGARTPRLLPRGLVRAMRPGAALVDLSIDQGGCAETSRPTTHARPTYVDEEVVHYCVTNMPAAVPHTATFALTNATLSYALEIADHGFAEALRRNSALRRASNVLAGRVTHPGVAEAERHEQDAEAGLLLRIGHADEREQALLQHGLVDPDAAPAELRPVEHEVVGLRADAERVALEAVDVLLDRRGERVMDGDVAIRLGVALEEREVDDPEEAILAHRQPSQPFAELEPDAGQDGRRQRLRLGEQQEQVAGLEARRRREPRPLARREELRGRRLPAVRTDPDPREPAGAFGGREADQVVELAARERRA